MTRNLLQIFILVLFNGIGLLPCASQEFLARREIGESQFRVMNWNVYKNSILHPEHERRKGFIRMVHAVKPDIICLQELNELQDGAPLVELMNAVYPLEAGQTWHVIVSGDCAIVSKYPILQEAKIPGWQRSPASCLVDLPDAQYRLDLMVVNKHFRSGGSDESVRARQRTSDNIVSWIREARHGTGAF